MAWKMDWSSVPICFKNIPTEPVFGIPVHDSLLPVMIMPDEYLSRGLRGLNIQIYMLLGFFLPPGNMKSVAAGYMLDQAIAQGLLKPGGIVVEYTSGGMGIALAYHGKRRGINVVAIVSDDTPMGKRLSLSREGAEVLTESEVLKRLGLLKSPGGIKLAEMFAEAIRALCFNQYANPLNPASYEELIAELLWKGIGGHASLYVAPVGSRGILLGLGRAFRKWNPAIEIVGTMPYLMQNIDGTRTLSRQKEVSHRLEPLEPYVFERIDEVAAQATCDRLNEIGIPCGRSGGAGYGSLEHLVLTAVEEGTIDARRSPDGYYRAILPLHDTRYPYELV